MQRAESHYLWNLIEGLADRILKEMIRSERKMTELQLERQSEKEEWNKKLMLEHMRASDTTGKGKHRL